VATQQRDFADFYRTSRDECLRIVLVSVGDQDTAQEPTASRWPLSQAAQACFGADQWPAERVSIEFDVANAVAVVPAA
jgi:hypothetical protein